ncbi:MAG TPA: hypothetical protein VF595_02975, partial [Tepidisphaeraceae bacterium]
MPRRSRYSRPFMTAVGSIVAISAVAVGYKIVGQQSPLAVMPTTAPAPSVAPTVAPPAPRPVATDDPKTLKLKVDALKAKVQESRTPAAKPPANVTTADIVLLDVPATRPALAIASRPAPSSPVDAPALFRDVDAKIAADDLLSARDAVVNALDAKAFSATEREAAFERLQKINDTVVFSPRKFLSDPNQTSHTVKSGDNM